MNSQRPCSISDWRKKAARVVSLGGIATRSSTSTVVSLRKALKFDSTRVKSFVAVVSETSKPKVLRCGPKGVSYSAVAKLFQPMIR